MADETPKGDRIAKVLARAGVASRRDAEKLIAAGRIKVNGQKILSPALNVHPTIKLNLTALFWKPLKSHVFGYITNHPG